MNTSLNTLKSIALSAAFLPASVLFSSANAADVAKVTVNGMVCSFCAQGIEKTISKMPQTKAVYVNLDKKIVAVEPKDGQKLDMAKIKAGIVDAGYDVVKTETVANTTVSAIKAELTGKK
ncbi:heavy-metal-associated domain-containing protein [Variovorax sp. PCZ-1]|uniref:heavy-metal-associated domain-containing protein n=1 Tax=Variovorax sp. PCZ-1 TaxID=2835533 RepID=UPI001BCEC094|nr:heavy-metal-associated domain-containing protein [Variovorax sp. PCZ-1]MBS7806365.1 heavy-metal-associated domain-containing protein [Variovorax sp. PCZ-1]